jgi:hypothetical protein
MENIDKIKCLLIDFEQNDKTLDEAAKEILRLFSVVGRSEHLARKSCDHACSPSDYYKGGKCDKMGCYEG